MSGFTVSLLWLLLFAGGGIFLAYQRIDLRTSTIATGAAVLVYLFFGDGSFIWNLLLLAAFGLMVLPNLVEVRREKLTKPLLDVYRKIDYVNGLVPGLFSLGLLYEEKGDLEKSEKYFREVLAINPEHIQARKKLKGKE